MKGVPSSFCNRQRRWSVELFFVNGPSSFIEILNPIQIIQSLVKIINNLLYFLKKSLVKIINKSLVFSSQKKKKSAYNIYYAAAAEHTFCLNSFESKN